MTRAQRISLPTLAAVIALAVSTLSASGCTRGSGSDEIRLTVFAASSLTDGFAEVEQAFEAANPGVDVIVSTAGSQALRLQIEQGADADVFASANPAHVEALVEDGMVVESRPFIDNALVIAVPADNPAGVTEVANLANAERIVIGAEGVPIGRYTLEFFAAADEAIDAGYSAAVRRNVVSEEGNVRLVIGKVEIGEADAAIVYRTDAATREGVQIIDIPSELAPRAEYRIGVVGQSAHAELAEAWVSFVSSGPGLDILVSHGFLAP